MWNKFLDWNWTSQLSTSGDEPNFFSAVISLCQIMDLDVHPCKTVQQVQQQTLSINAGLLRSLVVFVSPKYISQMS